MTVFSMTTLFLPTYQLTTTCTPCRKLAYMLESTELVVIGTMLYVFASIINNYIHTVAVETSGRTQSSALNVHTFSAASAATR